jgi:hypothetical protein
MVVFMSKQPSKEDSPVHLTAMLYSESGAMISEHMKSGEKAFVLYVFHRARQPVVYRLHESLTDFLKVKSEQSVDYPATLYDLQDHGILCPWIDNKNSQLAAFFLGVPTHAQVADEAVQNGIAFFFDWLQYKARNSLASGSGVLPAVFLHNLCDIPDDVWLHYMIPFKHTVDRENVLKLTVASLQTPSWAVPFSLVLSLSKRKLILGISGPGCRVVQSQLNALGFLWRAHDPIDDERLVYDSNLRRYIHPHTGDVVSGELCKYVASMRDGLVPAIMEVTCHTAMLLKVIVGEGSDISIIQHIIDEISARPWVVRDEQPDPHRPQDQWSLRVQGMFVRMHIHRQD